MKSKTLTVIVPCFNEQDSIASHFNELIELCEDSGWSIIAINDGSTDYTDAALKSVSDYERYHVITHKRNRGYGAAIKTGIEAVETEYAITVDADGQHYVKDIGILFKHVIDHDADMIVGSRYGHKSSSMLRGVGKSIIRNVAKIFIPTNIYDINSGMKIFRTDIAQKYLHLCPDGMSYSDIITLLFISNGHLVLEKNIDIKKRLQGTSTIGMHTAYETIIEILNIVMLFNPMKLFLPLSMVFLSLGGGWGIYQVSLGHGISVASNMLIIMGVLVFLLGLISEQLSKIRQRYK